MASLAAGHIRLRLARRKPLKRLLPLMRRQLARPTELTPRACARLRPSPVRARISSRSNSAKPPRTVSIRRPCGVVVSAQEGPEADAPLGKRVKRVEQIAY
jgi:hypothetical protein